MWLGIEFVENCVLGGIFFFDVRVRAYVFEGEGRKRSRRRERREVVVGEKLSLDKRRCCNCMVLLMSRVLYGVYIFFDLYTVW